MIVLDRELRALLEEDALHAPSTPGAGAALRRAHRRQVTFVLAGVAMAAAVVVGSLAGVSALVRTFERRIPIGPSETPAPSPIGGFACPSGSTPDTPGPADGPRPAKDAFAFAAMAFDPSSGRMLLLTSAGAFWTFDVCTNSWETAPAPDGGAPTELVFDVDAQRVIAIERGVRTAQVWTYEPAGRTWTPRGQWAIGAVPTPMFSEPLQAVYDAATGLVLVRDQFASTMWTYDVDTDTWTEVDQGVTLPPAVEGTNDPPVELLTYDTSVDRLVLYVTQPLGTWEFDLGAGRWEEQETNTPVNPGFGWFATGEELVYDEANEVSVLFSGGTLATYDASLHRWDELQGGMPIEDAPADGTTRLYFAMAYDPVNARIVVAGGDAKTGDAWRTTDDVIALDVATGAWITLLEPSAG